MPNVLDISRWYINNNSDVAFPSFDAHAKLQKLLYYSKAMYYAVYDEPLFTNNIKAWENGPVVDEVFFHYRHNSLVESSNDASYVNAIDERVERILRVVNHVYGSQSARRLIDLTHEEEPWAELEELAVQRKNPVISDEKIKSYYRPLKDIFEMIDDEEINNTAYDEINGNIFSYDKTETQLDQKDLEDLYIYGEKSRNQSYFVYKDENGELVVY